MKFIKKFFKYFLIFVGTIILIIAIGLAWIFISANHRSNKNMELAGPEPKVVTIDNHAFIDLNKNGKLDTYEDVRKPREERLNDLMAQMTLDEKVGLMFQTIIVINTDGTPTEHPAFDNLFSWGGAATSEMILHKKMSHFNLLQAPPVSLLAKWHNDIQKMAQRTRLGIPVTISSDPRNAFSANPTTSMLAGEFSLWPEQLGFAAARDPKLMREFGDIARQEYLAVGIRLALHPMADLSTEPRWPRNNGTFGEDAQLSGSMVAAYIRGFQGDSLGKNSVACMTKHFPGGGPQKEGLDPHFPFAKGQVYPGNNFQYHLIPFDSAFAAHTAQIMPYYGAPIGVTKESIGFGFNKEIVTDLLRNKYHFEGVVCTDWGLLSDVKLLGYMILKARARGEAENMTPRDRMLKVIDAGCDQFGGELQTDMLIELVKEGKVSEERINTSVRRILRDKFTLGLFDNPFVDAAVAPQIVGKHEFKVAGEMAQRKSIVLLKNDSSAAGKILPLSSSRKIYIENIDPKIAATYGVIVDSPEKADIAILRLSTPFVPMKGLVESLFHHGDLDFKEPEKSRLLKIMKTVPTVVDIYMDRPAVIPEISEACKGLIVNFGAQDAAILDVIFGKFNPHGKLPFELPSSMEAVRNQKEDLPHDSVNPLYVFGSGASY